MSDVASEAAALKRWLRRWSGTVVCQKLFATVAFRSGPRCQRSVTLATRSPVTAACTGL